jgi:hypothetical protein
VEVSASAIGQGLAATSKCTGSGAGVESLSSKTSVEKRVKGLKAMEKIISGKVAS